mmetsp:Transcript_10642/g.23504  ORF Transcript_10642/g.23504 Transcript_10642/m.23504 type:complete len:376 (+) Transcript_10642:579-1706(+)
MDKDALLQGSKCLPWRVIVSEFNCYFGIGVFTNGSRSSTPYDGFDILHEFQLVCGYDGEFENRRHDLFIQAHHGALGFHFEGRFLSIVVVFHQGPTPGCGVPSSTQLGHPHILRDHPGNVGRIDLHGALEIHYGVHCGFSGAQYHIFVLEHLGGIGIVRVIDLIGGHDTDFVVYRELQWIVMWNYVHVAAAINQFDVHLHFVGYRSIDTRKGMKFTRRIGVFVKIILTIRVKGNLFILIDKVRKVFQNLRFIGSMIPGLHELTQQALEPIALELLRGNPVDDARLVQLDIAIGIDPMASGGCLFVQQNNLCVGKFGQERIHKGECCGAGSDDEVVAFELGDVIFICCCCRHGGFDRWVRWVDRAGSAGLFWCRPT